MLAGVMQAVYDHVFIPFITSADFRQGFLAAAVIVLVMSVIFRFLQKAYKAFTFVFTPAKEPATKPGKSPWQAMTGCAVNAFGLGLGFLLLIAFLRLP